MSRDLKKSRWLKRLLLLAGGPVVFFLLVEGGFRLAGFRPRGSYLKQVDTLEVWNNLYVGEDGIYRARQNYPWPDGVEINDEGFRSIPFDQPGKGLEVMLVSDSFGWGYSAEPISMSFADRLNTNERFTVYNLSISGTGPEQYALLARKYLPLIQPDILLLMPYLGNDINLQLQPAQLEFRDPAQKQWYVTNAGIFSAVDSEGNELTAQEAYDRARTPGLRVINTLRKTAAGTQFVNWIYNIVYRSAVPDLATRKAVNGEMIDCLKLIGQQCAQHGAELVIVPLPVNPQMENTRNSMADNRILFEGYDVREITTLGFEDYAPFPDDHLNNSGHRKVAQFLEDTLAE